MMEVSTPARDKVRAPRFEPTLEIYVSSKTIGTDLIYHLRTENVSRSGMLLSWSQSRPIPFLENTILELTVDPKSSILSTPVQCLGRIVRCSRNIENTATTFGINIVQIDDLDLEQWEQCVTKLVETGVEIEMPEPFEKPQIKKIRRRA